MYYHVEGLGFTHLTAINTNMGCIYKSPLRSQEGPHSFVPAERQHTNKETLSVLQGVMQEDSGNHFPCPFCVFLPKSLLLDFVSS